MPRFVILLHDIPTAQERPSHFDFMLEQGPALRTWALLHALDEVAEQSAEALADHRLAYLDYEGPISGNRGNVTRWDAGTYELLAADEPAIELRLHGTRLRGVVRFTRADTAALWRYSYAPDKANLPRRHGGHGDGGICSPIDTDQYG